MAGQGRVRLSRQNDEAHAAATREGERLRTLRAECYAATSSRFCEDRGRGQHDLVPPGESPSNDEPPGQRWPGGARFAVCLTHDVDNVAAYSLKMLFRRMRNQLPAALRTREDRAVRGLKASLARSVTSCLWTRPDPLACYERWLDIESAVGARSTFLFLPDNYEKRHYSDGGYRYEDRIAFDGNPCTVGEMMREIHRRGWEVGLHASWTSYDSVARMKRQKEQVEKAIDAEVVSVRHHNLHFDIRETPRVHHEAGLLVDSSIGFNDDVGFRYNTCHPWLLRDLEQGRDLGVVELPLIVQEKCLVKNAAGGDAGLAVEKALSLADRVRDSGGVLTLLWHPGTIRSPLYVSVYERLLTSLKERGAWFGTMAEVADYWRRTAAS